MSEGAERCVVYRMIYTSVINSKNDLHKAKVKNKK